MKNLKTPFATGLIVLAILLALPITKLYRSSIHNRSPSILEQPSLRFLINRFGVHTLLSHLEYLDSVITSHLPVLPGVGATPAGMVAFFNATCP